MTASHAHWNWTRLGIQMGWATTDQQRRDILAAARRMTWSAPAAATHRLGPAVEAIAVALRDYRTDPLSRIGTSRITADILLIGLERQTGDRSYLLDLDDTAVHVLTQHHQREPVA